MSELKLVYSPRLIMSNAWKRAREGAHFFGGRPVSFFRLALKAAWAQARTPAQRLAAMRASVRASIATLKDDVAACDRYLAAMYASDGAARQEARQPALEAATAVILTFRDRHARRAAEAVTAAERSAA